MIVTVLLFVIFPSYSEYFSRFGSLVSALLGFITVLLLIDTLRISRRQNELASKQFIDQSFFSFLSIHDSIADSLERQNEKRNTQFPFFVDSYAKLDSIRKSSKGEPKALGEYFYDNDWMVGHYFRNILNLLRWIDVNDAILHEAKLHYVRILGSRLSANELRLLLYYSIAPPYKHPDDFVDEKIEQAQSDEKTRFRHLARQYKLFDPIRRNSIPLILPEDWGVFDSMP